MTIWGAYNNSDWLNGFKLVLKAEGLSTTLANRYMLQFTHYVNRINSGTYWNRVVSLTSYEDMARQIDLIFNVEWKDQRDPKYQHVPGLMIKYLTYLDTAQAFYNEYFTDEFKMRLENPVSKLTELSEYELNYIKDGKLTILINPNLIVLLRKYIDDGSIKVKNASMLCKMFYGELLPEMTESDYQALIEQKWKSHGAKRAQGRRDLFKLTYKDGHVEEMGQKDCLVYLVETIGPEAIMKKRLQHNGEDIIAKRSPIGQESLFSQLNSGFYLNLKGNSKAKLKTANLLSMMFNLGIKITLA